MSLVVGRWSLAKTRERLATNDQRLIFFEEKVERAAGLSPA
jgi:hypothetical protein